jgi:acyl carrier protein
MSTDIAQTGDRGAVMDAITEAVRAVLRLDTAVSVTESTRLVDLGMDSSEVFGLLLELEDRLGIQLDTDLLELGDLATAGSLSDFVAKCSPA